MKEKIKLRKIDKENWKFVLYKNSDGELIGDFVYSPVSFVDLSMLILLNEVEKRKASENRGFLIELSERIRNDYKDYLHRSLNREDFEFMS